MASKGLFKLMITLVICMLGGVRGNKLLKTTAGKSDTWLESLLGTECAIILDASFELEEANNQDYTVIWDKSHNNMPSSKLAIGLQKHELIDVLEGAGFTTKSSSSTPEVKMCRYVCSSMKFCKSNLLRNYERLTTWDSGQKFIYSPTETVKVKYSARLTRKMKFQNLSRVRKEKLLFDRYIRCTEMIAGWQKTTAEHHFHLYETASIHKKITKCLDKWQENVQYRDKLCTTTALLIATRANRLSFTGENACLSTDENASTKVDAGPGLELTTIRDHTMVTEMHRYSYLGVTILGLPYLLEFPAGGWPKGFITGDRNIKNSLFRLAKYSDLDKRLFGISGALDISYKGEKVTIAGDQHNQAHAYQQFRKNVISNVTGQITKLKQLN